MEATLSTNFQVLIQHPKLAFVAFQEAVEALGSFEKIKEGFERYKQDMEAERGQEKREIQAERVLMKEQLSTATFIASSTMKVAEDATSELSLLNNRYSLPGQTANRTLQQIHQVSFMWVLPWAFSSGANYTLKLNSASGMPDQQSGMLDTWVTSDLFSGKAGQLRLSGFNLLGVNTSILQTSGVNFTEGPPEQYLQRTILFSFVYRLQNLHQ